MKFSIFAVCALCTLPIRADLIVSTFGPGTSYNHLGGQHIGTEPTHRIPGSYEWGAFFTPGQNYTLDSITLPLTYTSGPNQFTVRVVSGATPTSAILESFNVENIGSDTLLTLTSTTHPVLSAGALYWVLVTAPSLTTTFGDWLVGDQGLTGGMWVNNERTSGWTVDLTHSTTAYAVYGTLNSQTPGEPAPEPASLALAGAGLSAMLWVRFRRR